MLGDDGNPRVFDRTIMRRKLGKLAKGKSPGYSGNGPDLYAAMPGGWMDWAVKLANSVFRFVRQQSTAICHMTETEFSTLLGDLKWCFDTPASTVIELALMQLGVPELYINMLRDIDVHIVRSTRNDLRHCARCCGWR